MRQRRVLHIVTSLNVGGIETYVLRLLKQVDRNRFQMDVCYAVPEPGTYEEDMIALGVKLFYVPGKLGVIRYVPRLRRLLKEQQYDTVCDFTGDFSGASMLAAALAGVKCRVTFYRSSGILHKNDCFRAMYQRVARCLVRRFSTVILSNSRSNFEAFFPKITAGKGKFHVVPNGVNLQEFCPVDAETRERSKEELGLGGKLVIGHVGRLRPVKNHLLMLRVFEKFHRTFADATLLLVGEGAMRPEIEQEIERLGLSSHVVMAGLQRQVDRYLKSMDIFWFPSIYEGLPNAMMEAQASGLAVLASDASAVAEYVPAAAQKYVIALQGDEAAWLKALTDLATDENERKVQGRINRQHSESCYPADKRRNEFVTFLSGRPTTGEKSPQS